ncbi:MAG TPA: response regulator [Verrucomicrobiae bacterium]|nr:response regulator [Verrucomicrobiae bacterium]
MSNSGKTILLVEDNENDVIFMQRALATAEVANPVQIVADGQSAINYLAGVGEFSDRIAFPLPALLFLDLKLPVKSGLDVLAWLRRRPEFKKVIVLVLTTSREPTDIERAFELGANAYLAKPSSVSELTEMMRATKSFWLRFNQFC